MEPINYNINAKELQKFGLSTGALFGIVFGLALPFIFGFDFPIWPWVIFTTLSLWSIAHPPSLKLIYIPWMKLALTLGWINSRIILTILFFVIIFPMGLCMRLLRKDPMQRSINPEIKSYRNSNQAREKKHMENPY